MENFKNKKLLTGLLLVSLVLIIVGGTFAVISFTGTSDQNLIKSGKVSMSYTESSNVINLTDALPVADEVGKNSTEFFDFTIMSKADTNADDNEGIKIPYNLIIEPKAVDSDKDAFTNDQIKVYLTKVEGATETEVIAPTKISELTPVESNFNLYSTKNIHKNNNGTITTDYRLRAWIDYDVESNNWSNEVKQKQYKFGVNVNATGKIKAPTGADTIIAKVGTDGLVAESHPATEQLQATTDYRYTGADPNNYVSFNDEVNHLWRIIGVFETDDGSGNLERRIKLVGDTWTTYAWDSNNVNDWSSASLMSILNSGDYWNRTGSHKYEGLTEESKKMIDNAKWYLGGVETYSDSSNGSASHFYSYERGTTVYSGHSTSWVGKVGLIYPSDYGYATAGGSDKRERCLANAMSVWNRLYSSCIDNDWLHDGTGGYVSLTPRSNYSDRVFMMYGAGGFGGDHTITDDASFKPAVYLSSDVQIIGGTGAESDPYQLSL